MKKNEFTSTLRSRLGGLPASDIDKTIDYYSEIIDDKVEDGIDEEKAIEELGSIDDIVNNTIAETPLPRIVKEKLSRKHELQNWEILLIVLTSPIWFPFVLSLLGVLISIYATIFGIVIAILATLLGLMVAGISIFISGIIVSFTIHPLNGWFFIGVSLILIGLGILSIYVLI